MIKTARKRGASVTVLLLALLCHVHAVAHEGHEHAAMDSVRSHAGPGHHASERFVLPSFREAILNHLHNKIVHFPIVLSLVSLVALFLGRSEPKLFPFARGLACAAALFAGAAWITGLGQASGFNGEPKAWLVPVHRNLGIATTVTLGAAALLSLLPRGRGHAWKAALVAVGLVGATGYLGGLLSHG